MQKNEKESLSHATYKNYFKMGERPNIKSRIIKLLHENVWKHLQVPVLGICFLNFTYKAQVTEEKNPDKWDCTKIKNVCSSKGFVTEVKRQLTQWEKIFGNHLSDRGLIFRIYLKNATTQK